MGFIIVPIAARHASSTRSRRVGTELRETTLKITSDPRLRAGVRAAVEHVCELHGLTKEEQRELAAVVERECEKDLENRKEGSCAISIDEREDRIVVNVGPAAGTVFEKAEARARGNGHADRMFVKHFHRNPAHS